MKRPTLSQFSSTVSMPSASRPSADRLILPLRADLEDTAPAAGPVRIQLDADDEPIVIDASNGTITA